MGQQKVPDTSQNKTPPFKMSLEIQSCKRPAPCYCTWVSFKANPGKSSETSTFIQLFTKVVEWLAREQGKGGSGAFSQARAATAGRGSQAPTLGEAQSRKHGDFQASDFPHRQMLSMTCAAVILSEVCVCCSLKQMHWIFF